ncbi:hypothetical protein BDY21DRAFT_349914 [Lineolata rhizophorae]|uniref:BTB domain-containing protein n=1 Tax=Lineolata rhizophorae TaxID=578093 RepID=A0A6A6NW04_9PEZI|nr:hypothetical protein BDY21DRAFT_349914 [Lineolata rhizophorae]
MSAAPSGPSNRNCFSELRQAGKFSDVIITCGSHELPVHKAIVCSQSDVLEDLY